MKPGISAFAWTNAFTSRHVDLLPQARDLGFSAFEIPMFFPADLPVTELRRVYQATGLDCTICSILPPGINPISPDPTIRARSLTHLEHCVETAAALGARILGGPLFAPIGYLPPHRPTGEEWSWALDLFQAIAPLLDRHELTLSLEPVNRSETFFLRTAAEANALCAAIGHPRIGVTIDTFHANIEEKSIPTAIASLGPRLKHTHLSENDRGLLGSGHVDFPTILAALKANTYDGYLMIEGFGFSPSEPYAPGFLWADKAVSPTQLAKDGLTYLTHLL